MIRRKFIALLASALIAPGAALADDIRSIVIDQLTQAGFTEIRVIRTWLGRLRFEAVGPEFTREIVVNPNTGEVLRDVWRAVGSDDFGRGLFDDDDDDDNSGRSSKSGSSRSDDDDDNSSSGSSSGGKKDDDDDDNSSSGSSSSGKKDDDDDDDDDKDDDDDDDDDDKDDDDDDD
jgi:hypothetical protein